MISFIRHSVPGCFVFLGLLTLPATIKAAPKLPRVFGNHMVLQQGAPVPVWGWADPGETITVAFAGQEKAATADSSGRWELRLQALEASTEGREFSVSGTDSTVTFSDVLVGEVWVCSGQSNMAWSVGGALQPDQEQQAADLPLIRHLKIPNTAAVSPVDDVAANWQICAPNSVRNFTAVGYFFGRELNRELQVPIGLINSSWGGTRIEPWTPPIGFEQIRETEVAPKILEAIARTDPSTEAGKQRYAEGIEAIRSWTREAESRLEAGRAPPPLPSLKALQANAGQPTHLYNGLIHPLVPYAIRGAIWYQGESNGSEGATYFHKMRALVGGWRSVWEQGDFPFYFVQLANFRPDQNLPGNGDGYARIREAQARAAATIPASGMAVIIDIGQGDDIHPKNKQDVGKRLARHALARDYGRKIVPSGPTLTKHTVEGNRVRLHFDHVGAGLIVGKKEGLAPVTPIADGKLSRFAIAGEDRKFYWADAVIGGDTVVVSSETVPIPVAVRYAFSANPEGANLYNADGLPAGPFRTDDW